MKKYLVMLLSLFLATSFTLLAQDQDRTQDRLQDRKQDRIHQEDHLRLLDGVLYQYKLGVQEKVQAQIRLKNGAMVNPDGSYQLQNQDRLQLRNGECMDMDGNRYMNQSRFNNRKMMTQKQINRAQASVNREMNRNTNRNMESNRKMNQSTRKRGGGGRPN